MTRITYNSNLQIRHKLTGMWKRFNNAYEKLDYKRIKKLRAEIVEFKIPQHYNLDIQDKQNLINAIDEVLSC